MDLGLIELTHMQSTSYRDLCSIVSRSAVLAIVALPVRLKGMKQSHLYIFIWIVSCIIESGCVGHRWMLTAKTQIRSTPEQRTSRTSHALVHHSTPQTLERLIRNCLDCVEPIFFTLFSIFFFLVYFNQLSFLFGLRISIPLQTFHASYHIWLNQIPSFIILPRMWISNRAEVFRLPILHNRKVILTHILS